MIRRVPPWLNRRSRMNVIREDGVNVSVDRHLAALRGRDVTIAFLTTACFALAAALVLCLLAGCVGSGRT